MKEGTDGSGLKPSADAARLIRLGEMAVAWAIRSDYKDKLRKDRAQVRETLGCEYARDNFGRKCYDEFSNPDEWQEWCEGCKQSGQITYEYWAAARSAGAMLGAIRKLSRRIQAIPASQAEAKE